MNVTASTTTTPTIMPFINVGARLDDLGDGVDDDAQENDAEDRAGDRAHAALQAAAADDRGGDGVQLVAAALIHRAATLSSADVKDAGDRGRHGTKAIGQPLDVLGADAAEPGGLLVAAQGVDVPAE